MYVPPVISTKVFRIVWYVQHQKAEFCVQPCQKRKEKSHILYDRRFQNNDERFSRKF